MKLDYMSDYERGLRCTTQVLESWLWDILVGLRIMVIERFDILKACRILLAGTMFVCRLSECANLVEISVIEASR
jgi:hypothetical protein